MTPRQDLIETDLGDELVLLDPQNRRMFSLNPSGVVIWRELQKGASLEEAVAEVARGFEVGEAQARADAEALVEALKRAGLLE